MKQFAFLEAHMVNFDWPNIHQFLTFGRKAHNAFAHFILGACICAPLPIP